MIKFPNIQYRISHFNGYVLEHIYRLALPWILKQELSPLEQINAFVYSLSCERDLSMQIASIRSFLQFVGVPHRFNVVSDGTVSWASSKLLERVHPCVQVMTLADVLNNDLPASVLSYARSHFLGKKLSFLMSLPVVGPTIYTDSDILYFASAFELRDLIQAGGKFPYYLLDGEFSLDSRLINTEEENANPVNAGFLLLFNSLEWSNAITRLNRLEDSPQYFSEQTIVHLAMHQANARQLDPSRYVCNRSDETIYCDTSSGKGIVLRHYTGPIRQKFWSSFGLGRHLLR